MFLLIPKFRYFCVSIFQHNRGRRRGWGLGTQKIISDQVSPFPPKNVIVTKQNKNTQRKKNLSDFNLTFCILFSSPGYSSKRCSFVLFSNTGNGTEVRTSDITSKKMSRRHTFCHSSSLQLSLEGGQHSRRTHYITKLLPKLMEPLATSLGLPLICHTAPGSSLT